MHKNHTKKELLEEFVVEFIIGELKKNENIDKAVDAIIRLQEKQAKDNPDLNNYKNEKNQVEVSIGNLLKAIEAGVISNTTTKRLHELEERLTELERKILIEECKKPMVLDRQEIEAYYVKALALDPERLINVFIRKIVLYNDRIEVYVNGKPRTSPMIIGAFLFTTRL